MRANVFVKSMLRQPARSLLIVLIIAVAAFAFIMRAAEYSAIRSHFLGAGYYTVALLRGAGDFDDVSHAADFLARSPFMGVEDRRRNALGVLPFHSADIMGTDQNPEHSRLRQTCAIFTGTLESIEVFDDIAVLPGEWVRLELTPSEIFAGFPEHVGEAPDNIQPVILWYYQGRGEWGRELSPAAAVYGMEAGVDYLVMGRFDAPGFARHPGFPGSGLFPGMHPQDNQLTMVPLSEEYGIWYAEADIENHIERLAERIAFLNQNQRAVTINTTKDMNMMPEVFADNHLRRISQTFLGRLIDMDDYVNQRPVAVINFRLHFVRGINIGDILTIEIPQNQVLTGIHITPAAMFPDLIIDGCHGLPPAHTMELEVVGIFYNSLAGYSDTASAHIYIPDSVLPDVPIEGIGGVLARQYSFVLDHARFEQQFYLEYSEILGEMGYGLTMLWSGAGDFWQIMDSTLLISAFNVGLTAAVLLLVLFLASFVFLRQRWRDFAISRAIGSSVKRVLLHLVSAVFLFGVPAVAIGGGGALAFVHSDFFSSELLESLVEIPPPPNVEGMSEIAAGLIMRIYEANLPPQIIPEPFSAGFGMVLCGGIFVLLLVMIMAGTILVIRRPVLEMFQGGGIKGAFSEVEPAAPRTAIQAVIPEGAFKIGAGHKLAGRLRFVLRQIIRSPQKSVLTLSIALLFTVSMIYLQESMANTQREIDRLYDETEVHAEILPAHSGGRPLGDMLMRQTVDLVKESGMAADIYYEAGFYESFVIAPDEDGNIPENWMEIIGFNPNIPMSSRQTRNALDSIMAVTDLDMFLETHRNIESMGIWGSVHIDFAHGYDASDFAHSGQGPVPIIVSEHTLRVRGLSLGDEALLTMRVPRTVPIEWASHPAVIIGVHNEHIGSREASQAAITPLPFEFLEALAEGPMGMGYFRIGFNIEPSYNRRMDEVADTMLDIIGRVGANFSIWEGSTLFMLWDSQLNELTGAMEWVMLFLELLYPVTLFVAGVISAALSMLLIMQAGKNAAIMRSLGASKANVCAALCGEQLGVFLTGITIGLIAVFALGWGFGPLSSLAAAAVCLAGAAAGSLLGVFIVVIVRKPLEMLQIRE